MRVYAVGPCLAVNSLPLSPYLTLLSFLPFTFQTVLTTTCDFSFSISIYFNYKMTTKHFVENTQMT